VIEVYNDHEFKDKTTIKSAEVLAYLKAILYETDSLHLVKTKRSSAS
jgi:hypothetical protein